MVFSYWLSFYTNAKWIWINVDVRNLLLFFLNHGIFVGERNPRFRRVQRCYFATQPCIITKIGSHDRNHICRHIYCGTCTGIEILYMFGGRWNTVIVNRICRLFNTCLETTHRAVVNLSPVAWTCFHRSSGHEKTIKNSICRLDVTISGARALYCVISTCD